MVIPFVTSNNTEAKIQECRIQKDEIKEFSDMRSRV